MRARDAEDLTVVRHSAKPSVVMLGTYPPRECGIATFTQDTVLSLRQWPTLIREVTVCAVNDWPPSYRYGPDVRYAIDDSQLASYRRAARYINQSRADIVSIQHEYGIFRGDDGDFVLEFMRHLGIPIVTTLHTVLSKPQGHFKEVTESVVDASEAVVVLAHTAKDILAQTCRVSRHKIHHIPHGIPDMLWSPELLRRRKAEMGLSDRTVVSTFGLISPGKGIEYALDAVASAAKEHEDLLYLVIGRTHPGIVRREGETYRQQLVQRCRELGIERNVLFVDRYLSLRELIVYLQASDIYLMPYLNPEQIVSGTLAYALGAGKPTIATPFAYAKEVLADGRGMLVPFRDARAIADALASLLEHEGMRLRMASRAYQFTRPWVWREVGRQYAMLYHRVVARPQVVVPVPPSPRPDHQCRIPPQRLKACQCTSWSAATRQP